MNDDSQTGRPLLGATLLLATALATFAAAGAVLPVATRLYALGAGATAHAATALFAAILVGVLGAAWLGRGRALGQRAPLARMALCQCLVVLTVATAPVFHGLARGLTHRLWPLVGGTGVGDWLLRHVQGLALVALPAAAVTLVALAVADLVLDGGAADGPAGGFALGLAAVGIAIGIACGGMFLIPGLGMRATFLIGMALSGLGASMAVLRLRVGGEASLAQARAATVPTPTDVPASAPARAALAAALVAGAGLAVAAVAWARVVGVLAGPTEGASAALASTVMLGLGLGAFLASGLPWGLGSRLAVALLALGSLAVFGSMYFVPAIAGGALGMVAGFAASGASVLLAALVSAALCLPGSAAVGLGLAALAAGRPGEGTGRLARVVGAWAAGAALGGLVAVVVLVPDLGLRRTLSAASVALALAASALAVATPWRARSLHLAAVAAPVALAVLAGVLPAAWDPRVVAGGIYRYGASAPARFGSAQAWLEGRRRGGPPMFYREGSEAVVVVEETIQIPQGRNPIAAVTMTLDGRSAAGTGTDMRTQVLTGSVPILLHGPTDKALLIELLSGVTAGSMLRHPIGSLTVIEREPAVVGAADLFKLITNDPLADKRLTLVHDDPRGRLLVDGTRYDVIVLAAADPWLPHAAALLTSEGYGLLKSRLTEGGVFAQRVSLGAVTPAALPILLRTFAAAFPSVLVFRLTPDDLLLAGSDRPLMLDGTRLRTVVGSNAGVAEDLGRAVVLGANEVIMTLRLDRGALLEVAGQGPTNDDDHAPVQRMAERDLSVQRNDAAGAAIEAAWPGFAAVFSGYGATPAEKADFLYSLAKSYLGITADPVRALDIARELEALGAPAKAHWVGGEARLQKQDVDGALAEWEKVLAIEPDNLDALFSLGAFHLDGRDDRLAEQYLARAVAGHPEATVVRYHHGRALFNLGRYEQAIQALRRARPAGEGGNAYPMVDYIAGLAAARLGRLEEAETSLRAYLTWAYAQDMLTRVEVDAHVKLAEVLDKRGKRFDALQERQKAERLIQSIEAYARMQAESSAASGGVPTTAPAGPPGTPAAAPGSAAPGPPGPGPDTPGPEAPGPEAPVPDGR